MTDLYPSPEGFFVTTLAGDLTATSSTISLTALPVRITKGYMVIEPSSATKREVIHFTSVGVSSVTTADDTTDATDATGRGCLGSVALGGVTTHDQGVTVIIAAVEQYWARSYSAFTTNHSIDGHLKSGAQIDDTTADHQYVLAVSELAADRTVTLPLLIGNDTFVFADFIQTLVGKTLTSPVLNTGVSGTAILDEDDMASDSATKLATQQSIKAYIASQLSSIADWKTLGACTYEGADAPTYTISFTSDMTTTFNAGMRIKLTDSTVKYFIITAVGAFSGGKTIITVYGGTDYTLSGGAITLPYYSTSKAPVGFPLSHEKWTQEATHTSSLTQNPATVGTWYNMGSLILSIPIGVWKTTFEQYSYMTASSGSSQLKVTLSTANNSESDSKNTEIVYMGALTEVGNLFRMTDKLLTLTSKTAYYLNTAVTVGAGTPYITTPNHLRTAFIRVVCAYL